MPGLTYTLKADGTQLEKGLNSARQSVDKFRKDLDKTSQGAAKGMGKLGGASLQIQDIAVQAQMGTKASTIIMQQGTQLLSMFGPAGAIAGGVLGLGVLLYNSFSGGSEAAEKLRIQVDEVTGALGRASASGSALNIAGALKSTSAAMDELKKKAAELQKGYFSQSDQTELAANLRAQGDLYWQSIEARRQMLDLNDEDNAIIDARLRGETDIADELERQRKLKTEIASIKALGLDRFAESELIKTAEKKSDADKEIKEKKRVADAVTELMDGIEDDEKKINKRRGDAARKLEGERAQAVIREGERQALAIEADEKRFKAAEDAKRKMIEDQFTLSQKIALQRERVKEAQERVRLGGRGIEKAQADLAEAQIGLQDLREQRIQRIMGGSTSQYAAERADRRMVKARKRAERIETARQKVRDIDAKNRGAAPLKKAAAEVAVEVKGNDNRQVAVLEKIDKGINELNQKLHVA